MDQINIRKMISVKEAIMRLLTANHRKWYSSRLITAYLQAELGRNVKPTCYLLRLVKSGHIERAHKPKHLINSKNGNKEFIYRWSGRTYQDKIEHLKQLQYESIPPTDRAILMGFLSAHYSNLPDWYQRMML